MTYSCFSLLAPKGRALRGRWFGCCEKLGSRGAGKWEYKAKACLLLQLLCECCKPSLIIASKEQ